MEKEEFISLLKDPEKLKETDYIQFADLINQYPLFSLARIFEIIAAGNQPPGVLNKLLRKNSSHIHNLKHLYSQIRQTPSSESLKSNAASSIHHEDKPKGSIDHAREESILPSGIASMEEALLSFDFKGSEKNAEISETGEEQISITRLTESDQSSSSTRKYELIDKFIESNPGSIRSDGTASATSNVSENETKEDDSLITDTLARIYVRQGLYSKAIYSYEKLILKYPEKSAYFATQIEEIKKLINK